MVMVAVSTPPLPLPLPLQYHPHRLLLDTNHGNNRTGGGGGSYTDDGNFDSNMVIILAALLCALICALGLNSIVRCAIRCSHRLVVFDTPPHLPSLPSPATGLHKHALNDIPVLVYGSSSSSSSGFNIIIIPPTDDCPICLSDFAHGDNLRILPNCNHAFHVNCIDTWFTSRSSCPICRRPLCDVPPVTSTTSSTVFEEEEAAVDVSVRSPPSNGTSEEPLGFVVTVTHDS